MKTMRPTLTIQLNRSRKNSSLDVNNGQSGFLTPIDQTISTPVFPPPNPQLGPTYLSQQQQQQQQQNQTETDVITPVVSRNDSSFSLYSDDEMMVDSSQPQQFQQFQQPNLTRTSSIASSVAGDSFVPNVNFTKTFDNLILSTYQSYVNRPDITPFDPKYPPSGIASRVSRDVLKTSINDKIVIDYNLKKNEELWLNVNLSYTLTVIRKRLFELCAPHHNFHSGSVDETPIEMPPFSSRQSSFGGQPQLQRQNSASSQSFAIANGVSGQQQQQLSQGHKPSWLHLNSSFMTHRLSSTDSLVENVNLGQQQQQQQQLQSASRSNSIPALNTKMFSTPPYASSLSRWTSNDTDFDMNIGKKDDFISQQTLFQPPQFPGTSNFTPPQQQLPQLEDQQHHQLPQQSLVQLESPFHPTFNLINASNSVNSANGLQSPFNEAASKKKTDILELQDPLYNATHNRKRESLIKKRGGR